MAVQPYTHAPLANSTSIRVIRCVNDRSQDGLHFEIKQIDLSDFASPPYRCLSYSWGNPLGDSKGDEQRDAEIWERKYQVLLSMSENVEDFRSFYVTTNLLDFLKEFQNDESTEVRWIWVDAICINQINLDEQAAQVSMMGRIYKSCDEVIIWLGREGHETKEIFEIIEMLGKIPDLDPYTYCSGNVEPVLDKLLGYGNPPPGKRVVKAMTTFFGRAWFHRVWTVQECVLPPKGQFWCGQYHLNDMNGFTAFIPLVYEYQSLFRELPLEGETRDAWLYCRVFLLDIPRRREGGRRPLFLSGTSNLSAGDFCGTSRRKKCYDPRDHLFGMLGLQEEPPFKADYKMPVQDLYEKFSLLPDVLPSLFHGREDDSVRRTPGLRSWVPDWHVQDYPDPWPSVGGNHRYRAGGGHHSKIACQQKLRRVLEIEGLEVDRVHLLGGDAQDTISGPGLLKSIAILESSHSMLSENSNIVRRFWHTLTAGLPPAGAFPRGAKEYGPYFHAFTLVRLAHHLSRLHRSDSVWHSFSSTLNSLQELDLTADLPMYEDVINCVDERGTVHIEPKILLKAEGYETALREFLSVGASSSR